MLREGDNTTIADICIVIATAIIHTKRLRGFNGKYCYIMKNDKDCSSGNNKILNYGNTNGTQTNLDNNRGLIIMENNSWCIISRTIGTLDKNGII